MYFSTYIRQCRTECQVTQEKMVADLYEMDPALFSGLDTTTLSKWERGVTKPKIARQVGVLRYFQNLTSRALPCWENDTTEAIAARISESGMQNLLGRSRELVLNFPTPTIELGDLTVQKLHECDRLEEVIEINLGLDKDFNHSASGLTKEHFTAWATMPANAFYVCTYKTQFFGLLFSLKLKPEIFTMVMNFEKEERELEPDDFAGEDEQGSSYLLSFFALNEKAATALFIRYYAHLISTQERLRETGGVTMLEDARKLIMHMNLRHHAQKTLADGVTFHSYRATLHEFFACEKVVKMLLSPEG